MLTTASLPGPLARSKAAPVLAISQDPYDVLPSTVGGLSPAEAHRLATALACPDRFLIATPDGSDARPFLLALVGEARRRGERVLVLTADAEAANQVIAAILTQESAVVRAMVGAEDTESLPAEVKTVASRVLGVGRVEETRKRLTDTVREIGLQLEQWNTAAGTWQQLRDLGRQMSEPTPPSEADPARTAETEKARVNLPLLRQELADLAPMVEAKKAGKLFSKGFWKATFHADLTKRAEELESLIQQTERTLSTVSDQTPLPLKGPDGAILTEYRRLCESLAATGLTPPTSPTPEAIALAYAAAEGGRQEAEASGNFARQTLADLESDPAATAVQFLNRAAVVVGPRAALGDLAISAGTFDRTFLESAESVTQTEWEAITSTSNRMILMGDFLSHSDSRQHPGQPLTNGSHHMTTTVTDDLWHMAHRPIWSRDDGPLVAHVATVVGDVTREPLADRPEIELRFGTTADGAYVLAAVAFPVSMPVAVAKAFMAGELGEGQLVPLGPTRWHADQVLVCWPLLESHGEGVWIDLEPGVREQVVPMDGLPVTAAVSFDPALWTREAAEAWVNEKTRVARSRRTTVLEPALA
ncbi:hypothetical protein [Limnoglobus roseus]|uniref:hypothetical protein n=1 Tax=Limnoglobus roseus TaxID=2598579 RepID=UPI0011EAE47A|nr:hypothetical protein [Limnoglobus roseus]